MFKRWIPALAAALFLASCDRAQPSAGPATPAGPPKAAVRRIAVVPKGTAHDFWKSVHAGAVKAQRENPGVEITFRGPEREDDREQQIALVQNLISARYDAIVLAPLDRHALVGPVREAARAGIPVVIIDSDLEAGAGTDYVSFVATDNKRGGQLAGEKLGELLGGKGRVLVLRYLEGSASTTNREDGCIEALGAFKEIEIIDPHRFGGPSRASAQEAAENLLGANAGIDAVYCPNEPTTFGMLLALRARALAGKVKFVGFDASEGLVDGLAKGEIDALVVQNPLRMGYEGVKAAADAIAKKAVRPRIDTGVAVVTRANMNDPAVKDVIAPDLAEYLGK